MKAIPKSPTAFQARVIDALVADLWDRDAKGFPRLDALRAITQSGDSNAR